MLIHAMPTGFSFMTGGACAKPGEVKPQWRNPFFPICYQI